MKKNVLSHLMFHIVMKIRFCTRNLFVNFTSDINKKIIKIICNRYRIYYLSKLINLSFEKAIYFDNLKISKAVPIFKDKGNLLERNNYRPISLLSNINKIIEKLMYIRLYSFLSSHNAFISTNLVLEKGTQLFMLSSV